MSILDIEKMAERRPIQMAILREMIAIAWDNDCEILITSSEGDETPWFGCSWANVQEVLGTAIDLEEFGFNVRKAGENLAWSYCVWDDRDQFEFVADGYVKEGSVIGPRWMALDEAMVDARLSHVEYAIMYADGTYRLENRYVFASPRDLVKIIEFGQEMYGDGAGVLRVVVFDVIGVEEE